MAKEIRNLLSSKGRVSNIPQWMTIGKLVIHGHAEMITNDTRKHLLYDTPGDRLVRYRNRHGLQ